MVRYNDVRRGAFLVAPFVSAGQGSVFENQFRVHSTYSRFDVVASTSSLFIGLLFFFFYLLLATVMTTTTAVHY